MTFPVDGSFLILCLGNIDCVFVSVCACVWYLYVVHRSDHASEAVHRDGVRQRLLTCVVFLRVHCLL